MCGGHDESEVSKVIKPFVLLSLQIWDTHSFNVKTVVFYVQKKKFYPKNGDSSFTEKFSIICQNTQCHILL